MFQLPLLPLLLKIVILLPTKKELANLDEFWLLFKSQPYCNRIQVAPIYTVCQLCTSTATWLQWETLGLLLYIQFLLFTHDHYLAKEGREIKKKQSLVNICHRNDMTFWALSIMPAPPISRPYFAKPLSIQVVPAPH